MQVCLAFLNKMEGFEIAGKRISNIKKALQPR